MSFDDQNKIYIDVKFERIVPEEAKRYNEHEVYWCESGIPTKGREEQRQFCRAFRNAKSRIFGDEPLTTGSDSNDPKLLALRELLTGAARMSFSVCDDTTLLCKVSVNSDQPNYEYMLDRRDFV